jgi:hypothetical protein
VQQMRALALGHTVSLADQLLKDAVETAFVVEALTDNERGYSSFVSSEVLEDLEDPHFHQASNEQVDPWVEGADVHDYFGESSNTLVRQKLIVVVAHQDSAMFGLVQAWLPRQVVDLVVPAVPDDELHFHFEQHTRYWPGFDFVYLNHARQDHFGNFDHWLSANKDIWTLLDSVPYNSFFLDNFEDIFVVTLEKLNLTG